MNEHHKSVDIVLISVAHSVPSVQFYELPVQYPPSLSAAHPTLPDLMAICIPYLLLCIPQ